jgi:hypothetical protein
MILMARPSGPRAESRTDADADADDRTDHGSVGAHQTDDDSTLSPTRDLPTVRRAQHGRRAAIFVMWVLVIAGAVGVLGVHSATVKASSDGFHASLDYAQVARAGWDVPWHLKITKDGGFGSGTVTVAVSRSFFDIYETQGFHPSPEAETSDDQYVYLEFSPPPGDTLVIDYDAYIQPMAQLGRRSHLKVITDGKERVGLDWRTFLLP